MMCSARLNPIGFQIIFIGTVNVSWFVTFRKNKVVITERYLAKSENIKTMKYLEH